MPFSPTEGPLREAQADSSVLQSASVRQGEKANQFVIHLRTGDQHEENRELEAEMELNVTNVKSKGQIPPGLRKIPVQLQQTTARKQASIHMQPFSLTQPNTDDDVDRAANETT